MYGTIARMHPRAGHETRIHELMTGWEHDRGSRVDGAVGSWLFTPDELPGGTPTMYLVALFRDRASYERNADDPAQDAWYRSLRNELEDDPAWMDGTFEGDGEA